MSLTQGIGMNDDLDVRNISIKKTGIRRAISDFYLLDRLNAEVEDEEVKEAHDEMVSILDKSLRVYTDFAIGTEIYYFFKIHREIGFDEYGFLPSNLFLNAGKTMIDSDTRRREVIGKIWLEHRRLDINHRLLCDARDAFNNHDLWEYGYGGEAWGQIAKTLYDRYKNKMSPKTFVDRVWSLEHNFNSYFDKYFQIDRLEIIDLLDAQSKGAWVLLMRHASPNVRKLMKRLRKEDLQEW